MVEFTFIIPVYNAEKYIAQCLESIARQTCPHFEAIIIDDGSTDDSARICQEMAEQDSRFSYNYKKNGGVSSARNEGIEKATGEWLCFVDADDYLADDYLQTFFEIEPKADITFFGETTFSEHGATTTIIPEAVHCTERTEIEKAIYRLKCGPHGDIFGWTWDKMLRTNIVQKHHLRFAEDISFREDEIFTFDYCRYATSLRIIDKPLYFYRIHASGLTKRGLAKSELLPSSIRLEESMAYYSHPGLREHMLHSITAYRARDVYASPLCALPDKLRAYEELTKRHPQPDVECKVNHLTQYLRKSYWLGFIYCLIRKL